MRTPWVHRWEMLELMPCSFSPVVDGPHGDSVPMETLKQEVRNTLLNGAAVFFPDRQTRRSHLFAMMVSTDSEVRVRLAGLPFLNTSPLQSSTCVFNTPCMQSCAWDVHVVGWSSVLEVGTAGHSSSSSWPLLVSVIFPTCPYPSILVDILPFKCNTSYPVRTQHLESAVANSG